MESSKKNRKELTLKECLKTLSKEEIEYIDKKIPNELKQGKKLDNIEAFITSFASMTINVMSMKNAQLIKDVIDGKEVGKDIEKFVNLNFIFKIEDKYIVPKEIREIFENETMEERNARLIEGAYNFYLNINGVLNIDTLVDLLNKSDIELTREEVLERSTDYILDNDKIYLNALAIELDKKYDIYNNNKNNEYATYKLEDMMFLAYWMEEHDHLEKISNILGSKLQDNQLVEQIIFDTFEIMMAGYNTQEEIYSYLETFNVKLTKKEKVAIENTIDEVHSFLPLWSKNGKMNIKIDEMDEEDLSAEYIEAYILINGLIEIDKLQELLEKNHSIKLTKKEIEHQVLRIEDITMTNNIIHVSDFPPELMKELELAKKRMGEYKKIENLEALYKQLDAEDNEIAEIGKKYKLVLDVIEDIQSFMIMAGFNKEAIEDILQVANVTLSSKNKKDLFADLRQVAMNMPMWMFNGYSKGQKSVENIKVGRNDPCPCGSGKKYKHCCGK